MLHENLPGNFHLSIAKMLADGSASAEVAADVPLYRPKLVAKEKRGRVSLRGDGLGADALNIYVRRVGEPAWLLLAEARRRFPLHDARPSTTGRPERREYRAVGLFDDEEIGQPSPTVRAVWRA